MRSKLMFVVFLVIFLFLSTQIYCQLVWQKDSNNPVLASGVFNGVNGYSIRGTFDSRQAWMPSVIHEDGLYKMWYVGYENYYTGKYSIGYAISSDGVNWFPYQKNPVLKVGNPGTFEENAIWGGTVIKDDDGYKFYYGGFNSTWKGSIGLATSTNGIHWTKYSNNPVLKYGTTGTWDCDAVHSPCVMRDKAGRYFMWYSGTSHDTTAIGYATSVDGYTWIKHPSNPIMFSMSGAQWESFLITDPRVLKIKNTYHMFYFGAPGPYGYQIGYATSIDGITWNRYNGNPVIRLGDSGTWDAYTLGMLSVMFEDGQFKLWYSGRSTNDYWQIGYATSQFDKHSEEQDHPLPHGPRLFPVHPNPFNPNTVIEYDLPDELQVNVTIYNSLGQEVVTLVNEMQTLGHHSVVWNAEGYANGIYLCRIKAGEQISTQKIALIK